LFFQGSQIAWAEPRNGEVKRFGIRHAIAKAEMDSVTNTCKP
jgi:hypothetical protein